MRPRPLDRAGDSILRQILWVADDGEQPLDFFLVRREKNPIGGIGLRDAPFERGSRRRGRRERYFLGRGNLRIGNDGFDSEGDAKIRSGVNVLLIGHNLVHLRADLRSVL